HLPLTELYWHEQPVSLEDAPLHLIYLYYKWPDRYSRLQTAKQISTLLKDDSNVQFRLLYLQYLSKQQYEVDIVDYLSILLLLEDSPFKKDDIIQNISFPSLISHELVLRLGYMEEERDNLTPLYTEFSADLTPNRDKYNRYSNGLSLRYIHVIKRLEKEYKVPLIEHFFLEWEYIMTRHSCNIFDPYNFCSDQFYRQDKISVSFSWVAESSILSAYARTLAYAVDQHSIPEDVAIISSEEILPFTSIGINITPSEAKHLDKHHSPRAHPVSRGEVLS
nr:hypothetical protein [Syntrophaceae bacterium]